MKSEEKLLDKKGFSILGDESLQVCHGDDRDDAERTAYHGADLSGIVLLT